MVLIEDVNMYETDQQSGLTMSEELFKKFLGFLERRLDDYNKLSLLVQMRYDQCSEQFRNSQSFRDLVHLSKSTIKRDPTRIYVHLQDFLAELKAYKVVGVPKKRKSELISSSALKIKRTDVDNNVGCSSHSDVDGENESAKTTTIDDVSSPASKCENVNILTGTENVEIISKGESSSSLDVSKNVEDLLHKVKDIKKALKDEDFENSDKCKGAKKCFEEKNLDLLCSMEEKQKDKHLLDTQCSADKVEFTVTIAKERCANQDNKKKGNNFFITESDKTERLKDKITKTVNGLKSNYQNTGFMDKPKLIESTTVSKGTTAGCLVEIKDFECTSDKAPVDSGCKNEPVECLHVSVDNSNNSFDEKVETKSSIETGESLCEDVNITDNSEIMELTERDPKVLKDGNMDVGPNLDLTKEGESNLNERKSADREEKTDYKKFVTETDNVDAVSGEDQVRKPFTECASSNVGNAKDQADLPDAKTNKKGSSRQIRRLEKLLGDIRNEIEKVQEQDLSLDSLDEIDSCYIYEDRLKRKFVKVWEKLCQLKNRDCTTGRPAERRFRYNGTRYEEVNKKIEKFINRNTIFPDYHDIKTIVSRVNSKYNLFLGKGAVDDLAREVFTDVGNQLQQRRHEDFIYTFRSRLTDDYKPSLDPALFDSDLRKKLEENRKVSQTRLDEVIDKYANKQYEMGLEAQEVKEVESSASEDEEEEEENIDVPELEEQDEDCLEEAVEDDPESNLLDPRKKDSKVESSEEESEGVDITSYGIVDYYRANRSSLKSPSVDDGFNTNVNYCQTDLPKTLTLSSSHESTPDTIDCFQSDCISQTKSSFSLDSRGYSNIDFYQDNRSHLKTSSLISYKQTTFSNTEYCWSKNDLQPKSSLLSFNKRSVLFKNSVSKPDDQPMEKDSKVVIDLESAEDPVVLDDDDDDIKELSHDPKESMCCALGLKPKKSEISQNFNLKQEDGICLKIASVTSLACLRTMQSNSPAFCYGAYNSNYGDNKRNLPSTSYQGKNSTITSSTEVIVLSDSD